MIPQRVAYVVSTFPKVSETFIAGELAGLRERNVDVRVLSLKRPEAGPQHAIVASAGLLERTTYDLDAFRAELRTFRPSLVHAHFATEPTAAARQLAVEIDVPFTFTAHGYDVYRRPPLDFAARAGEAAAVITVSEANRAHLERVFRIAPSRVQVVPCGIDTRWFTPAPEPGGGPLIVCVARLNPVKQLDHLLAACGELRDRGHRFRCVIVGDGPGRAALEGLRRDLRLQEIVAMPGFADQAEVRRWWRRATVAVLSSRSEGMPVSLMEAAACGVPSVAPAVGGVPELIVNGLTGLVVSPSEPQGLAAALERLLADPALRALMGAAARRRAEQCFSRERQIDRLLAIWSAALS